MLEMLLRTPKDQDGDDLRSVVRMAANGIIAALILSTLYFGREVFVPIALAVLLSFVLAPLVGLVQHLRAPRGVAVVAVVVLAFTVIFALGSLLAGQLSQLAGDLPKYQTTISEKISSLRQQTAGRGTLERASEMLKDLGQELDRPKAGTPAPATPAALPATPPAQPVPVEVRQPDPGALESLRTLISPLIHPLATTFIIVIFVIFILLQREDLRNRLIRLAGSHDLQRTTAALDDAARRLSRFFLIQLAVNSGFGIAIGLGLWAIGVPSAILWGILAGVLRFVPYIGAFIGAAFPLTLAIAVDPSWTMVLWTAALFILVEPIVGHVIEPMLYGHNTGLSPIAVVTSATLWTALWGPIGLVLATPLTVCLVVIGRHVERLAFLDIMFGDRPALSPPEIFYQRMLAGDPTEAADKAEEYLKTKSLTSYYDQVAMAGLRLAQTDHERGALTVERLDKIRDTVAEFASDLAEEEPRPAPAEDATTDVEANAALDSTIEEVPMPGLPVLQREQLPAEWQSANPVLCIAARSTLDEAAGILLAQLISSHGLLTRVEPAQALSTKSIFALDTSGVAMICLVCLDTTALAHVRYAVRRMRRKAPQAQIVLCCFGREMTDAELEQLLDGAKVDRTAPSLVEALAACLESASPGATHGLLDKPAAGIVNAA